MDKLYDYIVGQEYEKHNYDQLGLRQDSKQRNANIRKAKRKLDELIRLRSNLEQYPDTGIVGGRASRQFTVGNKIRKGSLFNPYSSQSYRV